MVSLGDSRHIGRDFVFSRYGLAIALIGAATVYGLVKLFHRYGMAAGLAAVCGLAALVAIGFFCAQRLAQSAKD
jgi:Na+/proline symporter